MKRNEFLVVFEIGKRMLIWFFEVDKKETELILRAGKRGQGFLRSENQYVIIF
jgi:hypothetical protein